MPKFVDDLHVAGALQASADPAKVTNTLQKAVGQTVDMEQYLDTDGTTIKAKVDANFIATYQALVAAGLTGATSAARYVGATASGAPASGTFLAGDWVISKADAKVYTCTAGGTPGTWTSQSGGASYTTGVWPQNGRLFTSQGPWNVDGVTTPANGSLRAYPLVIARSVLVDRVEGFINTVGSAGALVRVGIYGDTNGAPDALVLDAGTTNGTVGGSVDWTITVNVTLPAGRYWLVSVTQGAPATPPVLRAFNSAAGPSNNDPNGSEGGNSTSAAMGAGGSAYVVAGVTGALPASIAGSGAWTSAQRPAVWLRAAN